MADFSRLIQITADASQAIREFNKFDKATDGAGTKTSRFSGLITRIPWAAVAAGATAAAVGVVRLGSQWQEASRDIVAATGATGAELDQLNEDLRQVYATASTNVDLQSLTAITGQLATLTGESGPALQDLTRNIVEASGLLNENAEGIASSIGQIGNLYGLSAAELSDTSDVLFGLTQQYGVSLTQISGQVREFGPVLLNAGKSVEETAEFFARLESEGVSVTRVMPALNAALRRAAEDGQDMGEALDGMIDSIRSAETQTEALAIATEAFGAEGAQRMTTFLRNTADEGDVFASTMQNASGIIAETADENQTLGEAMRELGRTLEVWVVPFATQVVELLTDLFKWVNDNREVWETIGAVIGATVGPAFSALAGTIQFLMDVIHEAIALVEAFLGVLSRLGEGIRSGIETIQGMGTAISDSARQMKDNVIQSGKETAEGFLQWMGFMEHEAVGGSIIPDMVNAILDWTSTMKDGMIADAEEAAQGTTTAFDVAKDAADTVGGAIESELSSSLSGLVDAAAEGKDAFSDFAKSVVKDLAAIIAKQLLLKALGGIFGGAGGGLLGGVGAAGASLPGAAAAAIGASALGGASAGVGANAGGAGGSSGGGGLVSSMPQIVVNNNAGADVNVTRSDDEIVEIAVNKARQAARTDFSRSMQTGSGEYARSMEQGYSARRRVT